jgi:hypothetical protein
MRRFKGLWVTGDFFQVLGVRAFRGRLLMPDDESACPVTGAVVSYSYWQSELGGRDLSPTIRLIVDNELVEIIGVTPPGFFGMVVGDHFDIALPFCQSKEELSRHIFDVSVIGRLRPGWTIQRATAEMDALSPGIFEATVLTDRDAHTIETYKKFKLAAYPASTGVSALRDYDRSLLLLLGIAGLVLLIACANLANLMLARASRTAISRWRVLAQPPPKAVAHGKSVARGNRRCSRYRFGEITEPRTRVVRLNRGHRNKSADRHRLACAAFCSWCSGFNLHRFWNRARITRHAHRAHLCYEDRRPRNHWKS